MPNQFFPQERLKVFISSAQRNENGTAWGNIRRRIKDYLSVCPFLNPYIIEDSASILSSFQTYEYQVKCADIVVTLIKGEVRSGTAAEFSVAQKSKRPILLYFLSDDQPDISVDHLKRTVRANDYCTYVTCNTFDHIEERIFKDIIENVIVFFQHEHFIGDPLPNRSVSAQEEYRPTDNAFNAPTKATIDLFSSCYSHAMELLNISIFQDEKKEESPLHNLGISALDWLITGKPFKNREYVLDLITYAESIFGTSDWLAKRWDANLKHLDDSIHDACERERQSLEMAKRAGAPSWIISDILIDLRNLEVDESLLNHELTTRGEAQNELDNSDAIVYLPIADRYIKYAYELMLAEEYQTITKSPFTRHYGTNLDNVISNVINYFFTSLMYGSFTHMLIARKALADILLKYAVLTQSEVLFWDAIKLFILAGNSDNLKKTVDHYWNYIYSSTVSQADILWDLADYVLLPQRNEIKLKVLSTLGMYLSSSVFDNAVQYLQDFSENVYWGNSESYFECISKNVQRLGSEITVNLIIDIIREQRFHLGNTLSGIIFQLETKDISSSTRNSFYTVLAEKLPFILENIGDAQIIPYLERQDPQFSSFLPSSGITLDDYEKTLYEINMNRGDWCAFFATEVASSKAQFDKYNTQNVLAYSRNTSYSHIINIVKKHYEPAMQKVISQEFFPLCTDILTSNAPVQLKISCIHCLCEVISICKDNDLPIPSNLIDATVSLRPEDSENIFPGEENAESDYACWILILRLLLGKASQKELLPWCIEYSKKSDQVRITCSQGIELFLRCKTVSHDMVDSIVLSIVFQHLEDAEYRVRTIACDCLAWLLDTEYHDDVVQGLNKASLDPSHLVRIRILALCRDKKITDINLRRQLILLLREDAHYLIRKHALEVPIECDTLAVPKTIS